jgi:hypothetical protein
MRDRVTLRLGGKDFSLLPTMGVLDAFEDRFGSIGAHVQRLAGEAALFQHRAFLIWQALQADPSNRQEMDGRVIEFGLDATKTAMFEAGLYSEALVMAEVELIERLIYTPEQYAEKKSKREAEAASLLAASQLFSASTPSI